MLARSLLFVLYLFTASAIYAIDLGDSVGKFFDNAKEAFCYKIDGTLLDIEACHQYRKRANQPPGGDRGQQSSQQQDVRSSASEMYHIAMERLQAAAEQASNAAAYFLSNGREYAQETRKGAYEIYKIAKDKLSSAAEQAYAAAGKLMANGQSYVEDARRKSADIYNEALARLNYAAEEAKVIAEEVFEGKEDPYNEPWENHDQVQDAYERVTDAAAKGLEKAYETFTELGKEAFQTVRDRRPGARSDEVFGESVDQEKSGKSAMGSSSRAEERSFEEALSEAKESQEGKQHRERYANPSAMIPPNQRSKYQLGETKDDHMRLSETLEWAANKKTIKEREGMQHTDDIIEQKPQKPADDVGIRMSNEHSKSRYTTDNREMAKGAKY